jgi:hypothetical protein
MIPLGYKFVNRKKPPTFSAAHRKNLSLARLGKKFGPMSEIGKMNLSIAHSGHIHIK